MKQPGLYVIHAAAVHDAAGVNARPGAVMVRDGQVVAAGEPESMPAKLVQRAEVIDCHWLLLMPEMANAHTHLELTEFGPKPYEPSGGFVGWVKMLRSLIATLGPDSDAMLAIPRAAEQACLAGVGFVGDITTAPAVCNSPLVRLCGQCYEEQFGLVEPVIADAIKRMRVGRNGLQPHAPYSASPSVYGAAACSGRPVSTHLAEHQEEIEFVANLSGPMFDYVRSINRWDDSLAEFYGQGLSPVEWMRPYLERVAPEGGWLVAHCNYVSDDDIAILADTNTSVAYCPIASEYFGHEGHRYREMLKAGINVCLGTDSIICAKPDDPQPLGLLSAMRRLYERDAIDPQALLAMATTNGAKALRMDGLTATLQPGAPARFCGVPIDQHNSTDPLEQVLASESPAEMLDFCNPWTEDE